MPTPHVKPAPAQLTLGSDTTSLVNSVIASLSSPETRRSYARGIASLTEFAEGRALTLPLLREWHASLLTQISAASVNARIYAVRRLIREAHRVGLLGTPEAWALLELRGRKQRGTRTGNWLTLDQARRLLAVPSGRDLRALRNRAILATLTGCGLRIHELATLDIESFQQREGRWVLSDIHGKGDKVRTVGVPAVAVPAIQTWIKAAGIKSGRLIRPLTLAPQGLSTAAIRRIVRLAGEKITAQRLRPHDLRRTCAKLCDDAGQKLQDIQDMLGHDDPATTRRYLGGGRNFRDVPNDHLGL